MHRFTIHGSRGSMPVWGSDFQACGGATSCYSLETDEGLIVIDAGTGISQLANKLASGFSKPVTILFSHLHLDHIMGLPFFDLLYRSGIDITLMGDPGRETDWKTDLGRIMRKPYWPVDLEAVRASVTFVDLPSDANETTVYGTRVSWTPVWHPQGCVAYRLETPQANIVVATDIEYGHETLDDGFISFCQPGDILIHDAQYTEDELERFTGFGHTCWRRAANTASETQASRLYLTHHAPTRTDAEVEELVGKARELFADTQAACDGQIILDA